MTDITPFDLSPEDLALIEYKGKLKSVLSHPTLLERLCLFVTGGGSPLDFAEQLGIKYAHLMRWVRQNKDRSLEFNEALTDRDEHTKQSMLDVLNTISMFDIRKLYDDAGNLKPIKDWPEEASKVVNSITPGKFGTTLKLDPRMNAMELFGKDKGWFVQQHKVTGEVTLIDLIAASWEEGNNAINAKGQGQPAQLEHGQPQDQSQRDPQGSPAPNSDSGRDVGAATGTVEQDQQRPEISSGQRSDGDGSRDGSLDQQADDGRVGDPIVSQDIGSDQRSGEKSLETVSTIEYGEYSLPWEE